MKWTPDIGVRVLRAIVERMRDKRMGACPLCGTQKWTVPAGFAQTIIQKELPGIVLGGETLPSVTIVCKNCGNTHFLNLRVLGLDDLLEPEPEAQSEAENSQAAPGDG